MLMNLATLEWDEELLDAFGVPRAMLPEIRPSTEVHGHADVLDGHPDRRGARRPARGAVRADVLRKGEAKCTYGTGSFLLMNTGAALVRSSTGCSPRSATRSASEPVTYALEGSIAVTGSLVQWFRDNLGLIHSAPEIETLARTVDGQRRVLHRARVLRACSRRTGAARRAASSSA